MRKSLAVIVVAVVAGGFVFIVAPNLLEAMHRSHQKRTLANIRTIATAWEARELDVKTYAIGATSRDPIDTTRIEWNRLTRVPPTRCDMRWYRRTFV